MFDAGKDWANAGVLQRSWGLEASVNIRPLKLEKPGETRKEG
jgi:hypothetical protein